MGGYQHVGMILNAASGNYFEFVLPRNSAEVRPQIGAQFLRQEPFPILGTEDAMVVTRNVGVWHVAHCVPTGRFSSAFPALKRWASNVAFLRNAFPDLADTYRHCTHRDAV